MYVNRVDKFLVPETMYPIILILNSICIPKMICIGTLFDVWNKTNRVQGSYHKVFKHSICIPKMTC